MKFLLQVNIYVMKNIKNIIDRAEGDSIREKEKILRAAWLVSFLAPLSTAIAHYFGRTSILLADFLRRSNEFLALFLAWYLFIKICKLRESSRSKQLENNRARKGEAAYSEEDISAREKSIVKLEFISSIFMTAVMIFSGIIVLRSAVIQLTAPSPHGWLLPGLLINSGGLVVNGFFWYKNYRLHQQAGSQIIANQWKFYRAKTSLDFMILVSLIITNFDLLGRHSWLADPLGALIVVVFIWYSATKIFLPAWRRYQNNETDTDL